VPLEAAKIDPRRLDWRASHTAGYNHVEIFDTRGVKIFHEVIAGSISVCA
jgi:hypothetical protein